MKGAIVNCLESLVKEQFGQQAWEKTLEAAGYDKHTLFNMASDIEDKAVLEIISTACKSLRLRPNQMTDAFGDHWVNVYTPKAYSMYCGKAESAREMLLQMDALHKENLKHRRSSSPPF